MQQCNTLTSVGPAVDSLLQTEAELLHPYVAPCFWANLAQLGSSLFLVSNALENHLRHLNLLVLPLQTPLWRAAF